MLSTRQPNDQIEIERQLWDATPLVVGEPLHVLSYQAFRDGKPISIPPAFDWRLSFGESMDGVAGKGVLEFLDDLYNHVRTVVIEPAIANFGASQ